MSNTKKCNFYLLRPQTAKAAPPNSEDPSLYFAQQFGFYGVVFNFFLFC